MRQIRRNNFNMVEIMLAVIVIALGIAGTFVLFPVGLNANKEAAAENSIADVAEYIAAFVQARIISAAVSDDNGSAFKTSGISGLCPPNGSVSKEPYEVDEIDPNTLDNTSTLPKSDSLYEISPGIYLYRQLSGPKSNPFVDFSAVAKVYLDREDGESGFESEYFPSRQYLSDKSGTPPTDNGNKTYKMLKEDGEADDIIKNFLLPVVIELSWPATVPEADREKRYFRFEIFNDQYELKETS